jgi:CRISPR-associated exonuclease Cas4
LLRDPILGLRGKPDYVLEEYDGGRGTLIPLELKPTRRARRLYESDAVQVGAYLMLLRATYGDRAGQFGYVRYSAGTFRVELTPELEIRVRAIVAAVRVGRRAAVVHRSHSVPARCANCPMRRHCDEALA